MKDSIVTPPSAWPSADKKLAFRTFLTEEELQEAQKVLKPSVFRPTQAVKLRRSPEANSFSLWLGDRLLEKLTTLPEWTTSQPVALGSWARFEICPRSDIDMLFCGAEEDVAKLVATLNERGLKIRQRIPSDLANWTLGVDDYDIISLLGARAFHEEVQEKLMHQQQWVRSYIKTWRKKWLTVIHSERKVRNHRYDSISNYLEPNIKYGKGGLRDLQQALFIFEMFPEKFADRNDVKILLQHHKAFLLNLRQYMHLQGLDEIIVATEQKTMSEWMGFTSTKDFMKEVQWCLSEVSFYTDWVFERAKTSESKINSYRRQSLTKIAEAFVYLKENWSFQAQEVVRNHIKTLTKKKQSVRYGRILRKVFSDWPEENFLRALFSSGLMEMGVGELQRLRGLVQHDQYHRYTVRAHLQQCLIEVIRLHKKPKTLGRLTTWVRQLQEDDWQILLWTALYHDLAKGKKGDHSTQGAQLVKKDFIKMKFSLRQTVEVAWMVQNHLLLSTAAFRRDPQDARTWEKLHEQGVKEKRLLRLAVFTALDIRATNPEAWNDWKEKLLHQLVLSMQTPKATQFMNLLSEAEIKKIKISHEFLSTLDPTVVASLPTKVLIEDYQRLLENKKDLEPLLWKDNAGNLWIRFHRSKDQSGLFLKFTQFLYATGCSVQQCFIQTFSQYGVYDWFCVKTSRQPNQLKKLLFNLNFETTIKAPDIQFDDITVTNREADYAIISFRGKNKTGALLLASQALYEQGFDIMWARAHTWGRQIDDVFCVKIKDVDLEQGLARIVEELLVPTK